MSTTGVNESPRSSVLVEMIETEKSFIAGLNSLTTVFANPLRSLPKAQLLKKAAAPFTSNPGNNVNNHNNVVMATPRKHLLLPAEDTTTLFSNVDTLLSFHIDLLAALSEALRISTTPSSSPSSSSSSSSPSSPSSSAASINENGCIGDIFVTRAPFLRMYSTYLNNYQAALTTLKRCEEQNVDFRSFLDIAHKDPSLGGLNIVAFLLLPVQRIPRYKMLLESLLKCTKESHPDFPSLQLAVQKISEIANQVNEKIRIAENAHKVVEVQMVLGSTYQGHLIEPTRRFIHQGELYKVSRHAVQKRAFFLFNDLLLYAKGSPSSSSCEYKGEILLNTAWISDVPDSKVLQNAFQLVASDKTYTMFAQDPKTKAVWTEKIQGAIDAMVAAHPELKNMRSQVKIPQVNAFYKHFTIPLDELLAGKDSTPEMATIDTDDEEDSRTTSPPPLQQPRRPSQGGPTPLQRLSSWSSALRKPSFSKTEGPKSPLQRVGENTYFERDEYESEEKGKEQAKSAPVAIPAPRISEKSGSFGPGSPRVALLNKLPIPPVPPSDLQKCLRHAQADPKTLEEITFKRNSVTVVVSPSNGQPYRLRPLPIPPTKPLPPSKRSTMVSEHLGFTFMAPENKFLPRNSTQSLEGSQAAPIPSTRDKHYALMTAHPTEQEPKPAVIPRLFKLGKAFWDSDQPSEPGELKFSAGQLIKILNQEDDEWWLGEIGDAQGWFPCAYVIEIDDTDFEEVSESDRVVEAMWSHRASHGEELSFKRGDLIRILWDEDPYWSCGEMLATKDMGWFPTNLVALWIDKEDG